MTNPIKAVFFDIDGTLVSFNTHRVSSSTVGALAGLRAKGIKVFVATGRMLPMIDVLDGIPFDGYITYNGAYCVNEKREVIYSNPIPEEDLTALVSRLETDPFPVSFMLKDEMTVNYVAPIVEEVARYVNVALPRVQDPRITVQKDVFQLCIYADDRKLDELIPDVLSHCASNRWLPLFADVNVRENNKQSGIDKMLEYYKIDLRETMAFGDGGNDIPMLKYVALGVARGNATDEIKAVADYITDSVDEDGICKALAHFGIFSAEM
jgi:Cof subfamily protein (haloacid dehalogenase superfamily)